MRDVANCEKRKKRKRTCAVAQPSLNVGCRTCHSSAPHRTRRRRYRYAVALLYTAACTCLLARTRTPSLRYAQRRHMCCAAMPALRDGICAPRSPEKQKQ
jgi:hypothetical protein